MIAAKMLAAKMLDVGSYIEHLSNYVRQYTAAGGRPPSCDKRRAALIAIPPAKLQESCFLCHFSKIVPEAKKSIQNAGFSKRFK